MADKVKENWLKLTPDSFPKDMAKAYNDLREAFETVKNAKNAFNTLAQKYVADKMGEFAKAHSAKDTSEETKALCAEAMAQLHYTPGKGFAADRDLSFGFRYGPAVASIPRKVATAKTGAVTL